MDSGFENSDSPADKDSLGPVTDVSDLSAGVGEGVSERGGIVTARGTGNGLIIRLDGRIEKGTLIRALGEFLSARRTFLGGQEVCLEWIGNLPVDAVVQSVEDLLGEEFGIRVVASRAATIVTAGVVPRSLFDGAKSIGIARSESEGSLEIVSGSDQIRARAGQSNSRETNSRETNSRETNSREIVSRDVISRESPARTSQIADGFEWDDPDARLVHATLRSGQRVESEHSIIIFGDVNSGAEIVAGGDIVVLGSLRGVAHAGAYDETGGGRVIFALNLQPTQLRIGSIISRGAVEAGRSTMEQSDVPEIARVEGALITVETYVSKGALGSKLRK